MKTNKLFFIPFVLFMGMGFIFFLSQCKKDDPETVEVKGNMISGICTYPDVSGSQVAAGGAVISLYVGSSASGTKVATAVADANGNYSIPNLLPNTYFLTAIYNTENQNNKNPIAGITFMTGAGYVVTMSSSDITQNVTLETIVSNGTLKIALDTVANQFRKVTLESHSKCAFSTYHNNSEQQLLKGGFNVFRMTKFAFDETNLSNSVIDGYVLASSVNTLEPARDAIGTGCVQKTLNVDTTMSGTTVTVMPETDTIRFYSTSIEKYGNGYICHGVLTGFLKHNVGDTRPSGTVLPADTAGGFTGPFNVKQTKNIDMYFEYQGKTKSYNSAGTTFNWYFIFEGEFKFNKRNDFYIISSSCADEITVTPHVAFKGSNNIEY